MKKKYSKIFHSKKRAISDIIVTLLLVAITVFGGVLAFALFNTAVETQVVQTEFETEDTTNRSVKLFGYDTRHGTDLGGITFINNDSTTDGFLKGSDGEFILLKVRNPNFNQVTIDKVNINDVLHEWDNDPGDADTPLTSGKLPDAGTFKIISTNNVIFSPAVAQGGTDITIVIKLHDTDLPDIALTETIRIIIGSPNFNALEFLIPAGGTS